MMNIFFSFQIDLPFPIDDILASMLVDIMEAILNIDTNGKDGYQFFKDLLDVDLSFDEDCLHLAVSTPKLPTVSKIHMHVPNSYLHFSEFFLD